MFNNNEKQLIEQAERALQEGQIDSTQIEIIRLRLRNVIEKHKEQNKRIRFQKDKNENSSRLSADESIRAIRRLESLLHRLNSIGSLNQR